MANMIEDTALETERILVPNWSFIPSPVGRARTLATLKKVIRRSTTRPEWKIIKQIKPGSLWAVFFIFCPSGEMDAAQWCTLKRLRSEGFSIFAVASTAKREQIPEGLSDFVDALYWKALKGYDFSAYGLALKQIAKLSPGADVFVMNDSVYGPFSDIKPIIATTPYELTGFTASSEIENHIQSYAFILKNVTPRRMRNLSTVFLPWIGFDHWRDVIDVQETRFARVASKTMSVGSLWFAGGKRAFNPTIFTPFELIKENFPFLKKSLLGKDSKFQNRDETLKVLTALSDGNLTN